MSKETKTNNNKKKILEALEKSLGVVTSACKTAKISRTQFYKWYNEDEDFKNEVDDVENVALDFAESQLHKQIAGGVPTSTIFYLKTKGKKRGYIERVEVDQTINDKRKDISDLFPTEEELNEE